VVLINEWASIRSCRGAFIARQRVQIHSGKAGNLRVERGGRQRGLASQKKKDSVGVRRPLMSEGLLYSLSNRSIPQQSME